MSKQVKIYHGSEIFTIHENGEIEREKWGPSGQWVCTGAVRMNNFGRIVERFSLSDVLEKRVVFSHKNGKQRCFLTDIDHGTHRIMISPKTRYV